MQDASAARAPRLTRGPCMSGVPVRFDPGYTRPTQSDANPWPRVPARGFSLANVHKAPLGTATARALESGSQLSHVPSPPEVRLISVNALSDRVSQAEFRIG
jgi:hypothetical protein